MNTYYLIKSASGAGSLFSKLAVTQETTGSNPVGTEELMANSGRLWPKMPGKTGNDEFMPRISAGMLAVANQVIVGSNPGRVAALDIF